MSDHMPKNTVSLTAKIIDSLRVHITALDPSFKKSQPVYALNWFDTSWLWLYNFYNLLASRSVLKVGGEPFFKARVERVLHGQEEAHRAVLLIVRYPTIEHFQNMLQSRYFQLVSIIRGLAVKQFTFAFSTRTDPSDEQDPESIKRIEQYDVYALYHYRLASANTQLERKINEVAKFHNVELVFASSVSARLYTQRAEQPPSSVDTVMDGCAILAADGQDNIESLLNSAEYQAIIAATECSYMATLNRIF